MSKREEELKAAADVRAVHRGACVRKTITGHGHNPTVSYRAWSGRKVGSVMLSKSVSTRHEAWTQAAKAVAKQ